MELRQSYGIVRRWLWLIAACTLVGAGSILTVSQQATPVYEASATLLVQQAPSGAGSDYQAILTSERLARTYSEMLKGRPIMQNVVEQLGLRQSPENLANQVSVELVRDTQLIRLKVEHTDPTIAARAANAVAAAFVSYTETLQQRRYAESVDSLQRQTEEFSRLIEETEEKIDALGSVLTRDEEAEQARLEGILAGYRNTYSTLVQNYEAMRVTAARTGANVIVFEEAQTPESRARPRTLMNTGLAGATSAMIGLGVAFLIEYLDDTVRSPNDVEQAAGLETVGAIGRSDADRKLVIADEPLSPVSEAFRKLRTNLEFLGIERQLRTVLVTSPGPREGKSMVAANLAAAAAQAGRRVILVEADLRQPSIAAAFERTSKVGLTTALVENRLDGKIQATEIEGLRFLGAGEKPPNPAEMLGSERMRHVLERLLQEAELVVIDTAPVLPVADSLVLAQYVDGVLLVVDLGHTSRSAVLQAVQSLRQVGANLVGAVLNNVPAAGGYYGYRYYACGKDHSRYYAGGGVRSEPAQKGFLTRVRHALKKGLRN